MKNKVIFLLCLVILVQGFFLFRMSRKRPLPPVRAEKALKQKPSAKIPLPAASAKIAIVLDDWGYNLNNVELLREIKYPLTLAVLPNLPHSKDISQEARGLNKEIILHLPMEPYPSENVRLEKDTVTSGMSREKISAIINNDLENILYAVGASNHMGSKLTQDENAVKIIFEELKKRKMFFLDSMTGQSVCKKAAQEIGIKFAARSVFLDNSLDADAIEKQINILVKKAKIKGYAIGIGHDRRPTLEALKRLMPELEKTEGVQFIFVSELAK